MEENRFPVFSLVLCLVGVVFLLSMFLGFDFQKPRDIDQELKNITIDISDEATRSIASGIQQGISAADRAHEIESSVAADTVAFQQMLQDALSD